MNNGWGMNAGCWDQSTIVPGAHSFPPQLEAESVLFKKNIIHLFPVKYNFCSMPLWGTCYNVRDPKKPLKSETPPSLACASPRKCCWKYILCLSLKPPYKTQLWLKEAKEVFNRFLPLTPWWEFISRWPISSGWTNSNTGLEARAMCPRQSSVQSGIAAK